MQILVNFLKFCLELLGENCNQEDIGDINIMFIVKDNNADVNFVVEGFDAVDAEGHDVPEDSLTVEVVSDNPDAVAVTFDPATLAGVASFGAPGVANINATIKFGDTILGSFSASFTVTAGDPATIVGGDLKFEGLTEA